MHCSGHSPFIFYRIFMKLADNLMFNNPISNLNLGNINAYAKFINLYSRY